MSRLILVVSSIFLLTVHIGSASVDAWAGSMYRGRPGSGPFAARMPIPRTGMWYQQRRSALSDMLEDEAGAGDPEAGASCIGAPCRSDDACCETMVCKMPENEVGAALGTCLPSPNEGTVCKDDEACGPGLECTLTVGSRGFKSCQPRTRDLSRKQLNEECRNSLECDQSRNLCCQLHRRHRQAPRQVCMYYKESSQCLGFKKGFVNENSFGPGGLKAKWWQY